MSQPSDDDRWFDILAGKAEPANADERKAASLRQYFELREQHDEQLDAAAQRRIENMMMAGLATAQREQAAQQAAAPAAPKGLWQSFKGWLMPDGGGHAGRYALVAGIALAVMAVPLVLRQSPPDDNGHLEMKRVPNAAGQETTVASPEPEREAQALVTVLQQNGITATVTADGADRVVRADINRDRFAQASTALASMGVLMPTDGHLLVRFKKMP